MQTAHSEKVSDLAFPAGYGEVFATSSVGCIRVWHLLTCRELLRINVPNLTCNCVIFAPVSAAEPPFWLAPAPLLIGTHIARSPWSHGWGPARGGALVCTRWLIAAQAGIQTPAGMSQAEDSSISSRVE